MTFKNLFSISILTFFSLFITIDAQTSISTLSSSLPLQQQIPYYPCVNYEANRLIYPADSSSLHYFYSLLDTLSLYGNGHINIVHLGGSHIQADIMTNRLRQNFTQCLPGFSSSRGIIFPFRAGKTNNPTNYTISYSGSWSRCQNSLPPIDRTLGITGIAVSTNDRYASISFNLNPNNSGTNWRYNKLRLMASLSDTTLTPVLIVDNDTIVPHTSYHCTDLPFDTLATLSPTTYYTYRLPYTTAYGTLVLVSNNRLSNIFSDTILSAININCDTLTNDSTIVIGDELNIGLESDNESVVSSQDIMFPNNIVDNKLFTINGFILEYDEPGITIHSLGVNGASLPSWLRCADFEYQLNMLNPDLVIMAVGVNDANVPFGRFNKTDYINNYNAIISQIHRVNPNCAILFVTNNDCVLRTGRRSYGPNRNTALVVEAMTTLAAQHNTALWDMYGVMGGLGSMALWRDQGLANPDRVHFFAPGYTLLADLMYNSIIYDWLYRKQ